MSLMEDHLHEQQEVMEEHLEIDAENNRKILAFLKTRVKDEKSLELVKRALQSGGDHTFDFGDMKVALGFDGLYHILQSGEDGKFHQIELPEVTEDIQRAA